MRPVFLLLSLAITAHTTSADTVDELLAEYRAQGAGPFSERAGLTAWNRTHRVDGEDRSCTDCHTADLTAVGAHRRTLRAIDPLAPSVNPKRLTDARRVEKWLLRNCKWTLGRACSPQGKGDFLTYIRAR